MKIIRIISVLLAVLASFSPIFAMEQDSIQVTPFQVELEKSTEKKALEAELFDHVFAAYEKNASNVDEDNAIRHIRKLVLENGVNIDALYESEYDSPEKKAFFNANCSYLTPLAYAIGSRKKLLIKAILDLGANVNYACSIGTPIDAAVTIGNAAVIDDLVSRGANINAQDSWGQTAVFTAIYRGDKAAFDALYKYPQLDCTVRENRGHTPLHFLLLRPNPSLDIVQKLIARGAKPTDVDYDGFSTLQIASELCKVARERMPNQPEYGPRAENYARIVSLLQGKAIPSKADSFLSNTLVSEQQRARQNRLKKLVEQKNKDKQKKKNSKKAKPSQNENGAKRESSVEQESTSPTKKTRTIADQQAALQEEPITPTKELRDGFAKVTLGGTKPTRLTFEDQSTEGHEVVVTEAMVDGRIKDWFDNNFLRAERAKTKYYTLNEFKKSAFYHQIPMKVMSCIITHGKPAPRASDTRPDDLGTSWILKGEMVFDDPSNNPWCSSKSRQEGVYHCTMNSDGVIYHVGFKPKPLQDATVQFGAFLPPELQGQEIVFKGFYPGITHHFKI